MVTNYTFLSAIFCCAVIIISSVQAAPQGMTEEKMQEMMKHAEEMKKCMGDIDRSLFKDMKVKGEKMQREINAFCKAGELDKAQNAAMKFGEEMASMPEMKAMKKCGEMAQGMMKNLPMMQDKMKSIKEGHVCDAM